MELTRVSGISSAKEQKLQDNGYLFIEDLVNANAARVSAIDGCSPQLIANAQRFVVEETNMNLNSVNYKCGKCGKNFHLNRRALAKHVRFNKCSDKPTSTGDLWD